MDNLVTAKQLAAMTSDQKIRHLQHVAEKQLRQLLEAKQFAAHQVIRNFLFHRLSLV